MKIDDQDNDIPLAIRRENYRRNHEFLCHEIDERTHQVWTIGSLFVPVSFLIFTYSVVNVNVSTLGQLLLMTGSLTCYLAFYLMYRRITLLNNSSYRDIYALEVLLGLSAHLTLKEFWNAYRYLRWRVHVFTMGLYVLGAIWTIYLVQSTDSLAPGLLLILVFVFNMFINLETKEKVPAPSEVGRRQRNTGLLLSGLIILLAALVLGVISAPPLADGAISIILDPAFGYRSLAVVLDGTLGIIFIAAGAIGRKRESTVKETPAKTDTIATDENKLNGEANAANQQATASGATPQTTTEDQDKKEKEETAS